MTTKKQAPWQILIGAANTHYCVLLRLAVWLKFMIIYDRFNDSDFLFAYRCSNDEDAIRKKASEILKSVLTDDEIKVLLDDLKGTQSIRKFATDMAKKGVARRMILICGINGFKNKCKITMLLLQYHLLIKWWLVHCARMDPFIII